MQARLETRIESIDDSNLARIKDFASKGSLATIQALHYTLDKRRAVIDHEAAVSAREKHAREVAPKVRVPSVI